MKRFSFMLALMGLVLSVRAGWADDRVEVIWGGLGVSGLGNRQLVPVASNLIRCSTPNQNSRCPIEEFALKKLQDTDFANIKISNSYAENRINYLVSPVIDAEWVSHVKLAEGDQPFVYQFLILGSLLIYEVSPTESQLLSATPVSVYATRYYANSLSMDGQVSVFEEMYLGNEAYDGREGYYNFFDNLVDEASKLASVPLKFPGYVKFTGVGYSEEASSILSKDFNLDTLSTLFASWATSNLAKATGEPIIPASLDNKLKLVFRSGESELILPEPMYEFDMYIQALETYKNSNFTCFDVASYYGVKTFEQTLLDAPIQQGGDSCAFLQAGTAEANTIYTANLLSQIQKVMFGFSKDSSDLNDLETHIVADTENVLSAITNIKRDVFDAN